MLPDSRHEARELQFLLSREQVIHKGGNIVEAHAFALLWANVGSLNADMGIVRMVLEQARLSLQVNNTWVNWLKSIPVVLRNIVAQGDGTASLVSCR